MFGVHNYLFVANMLLALTILGQLYVRLVLVLLPLAVNEVSQVEYSFIQLHDLPLKRSTLLPRFQCKLTPELSQKGLPALVVHYSVCNRVLLLQGFGPIVSETVVQFDSATEQSAHQANPLSA
jgi:Na+-transporting methylmalonyl-CoA/oxaloacetate decarboxylase gamma subunit